MTQDEVVLGVRVKNVADPHWKGAEGKIVGGEQNSYHVWVEYDNPPFTGSSYRIFLSELASLKRTD